MPKIDFPTILRLLADKDIGGRYSPVALCIGFLTAALNDQGAIEYLIENASVTPDNLDRLRTINATLQHVIESAEKS